MAGRVKQGPLLGGTPGLVPAIARVAPSAAVRPSSPAKPAPPPTKFGLCASAMQPKLPTQRVGPPAPAFAGRAASAVAQRTWDGASFATDPDHPRPASGTNAGRRPLHSGRAIQRAQTNFNFGTKIVGGIEVTYTPGYSSWEQDGARWHINWTLGESKGGTSMYHVTYEDSNPKKHYFFTKKYSEIEDALPPKGSKGRSDYKFSALPKDIQQFVINNYSELQSLH